MQKQIGPIIFRRIWTVIGFIQMYDTCFSSSIENIFYNVMIFTKHWSFFAKNLLISVLHYQSRPPSFLPQNQQQLGLVTRALEKSSVISPASALYILSWLINVTSCLILQYFLLVIPDIDNTNFVFKLFFTLGCSLTSFGYLPWFNQTLKISTKLKPNLILQTCVHQLIC